MVAVDTIREETMSITRRQALATAGSSFFVDGLARAFTWPEAQNRYAGVCVLVCNRPNGNNRIYPRELVAEAIRKLGDKPMLGTLGMPNSTRVELSRVSHQCRRLRLDGDRLLCDIEVLDTPCGRLLRDMAPRSIAFRTAGVAECREENGVTILTEYSFISINAIPADQAM